MTQQLHPWQNNEKFRSLDPKKQEMILQLTGYLQGHTITEALPALMEWKTQIDRENIRFTAEENELLTELFTENLSASGQKQYEFIKPFLQSGLSR